MTATVLLWYVATALVAWSFGYTIVRGSDLWWHVANGRWIWEHRAVPLTDAWSFTAHGHPWVNDAWLADLVFHLWERAFGMPALAWWKWGMLVATFVLLFRVIWRQCGDPLAAWVAVVLGVAAAAPFLDVRPHLWSLLGYVVLLHGVLGRARPAPLLPVLFLLWTNMHAMVLFGMGVLAVALLPALRRGGGDRRAATIVGAACAVAFFVNPNGAAAVTRVLRYGVGSSPFRTIGEWLPPFAPVGMHSALYPWTIGAFVAAVGVLLVRRGPDVPWLGIVLGVLTLAMSLRSRRCIPLFAISQSLAVGSALARLLRVRPRAVTLASPVLACALAVWWLAPYPRASWAFAYLTAEDTFPVETCNFIDTNALAGKVFAFYNWGGYLHLRTAGRMQVFIDGRADVVFDDDTYVDYTRVLGLQPGWSDVIEASAAEYVLWPNEQPTQLAGLVNGGRWRLLYTDRVSTLLERADRPQRELQATPDSAYRRLAFADWLLLRRSFAEAQRQLEAALTLDPHLGAACSLLARVQALQGSPDASATEERCQRLYPSRPEREDFAAFRTRLQLPPR